MKEILKKSNYKAILHSKRANIYYLEKCRVMQKDGRVVYLTESSDENLFWNIPVANTTVILLGSGTSLTQAAVRVLTSAGVMIGFCGGGGTPLFAGTDIEWMMPQSEYRPTEYMQGWISFWMNKERRLETARDFQRARCDFLEKTWGKDRDLHEENFNADDPEIERALAVYRGKIDSAKDVTELLLSEAKFTKSLYKYAAKRTRLPDFTRNHDGDDEANIFLNHGNYLAYGLAACTLWVLGIPHGFAVMHGKTRRGALVFDVADLIKDSIILPWSFISAARGDDDKHFRMTCLNKLTEHKALDYMFEIVQRSSLKYGPGDFL